MKYKAIRFPSDSTNQRMGLKIKQKGCECEFPFMYRSKHFNTCINMNDSKGGNTLMVCGVKAKTCCKSIHLSSKIGLDNILWNDNSTQSDSLLGTYYRVHGNRNTKPYYKHQNHKYYICKDPEDNWEVYMQPTPNDC